MQGLGLELFGYPYDSTFLNLFELVDLCWTIAYATPFLQRLLKELGPLGGPQAFAPASPTLNSALLLQPLARRRLGDQLPQRRSKTGPFSDSTRRPLRSASWSCSLPPGELAISGRPLARMPKASRLKPHLLAPAFCCGRCTPAT